tara:strand:- start:70 stop:366 length:297 start_codon:yes stop_codon:yes gene_type:complete
MIKLIEVVTEPKNYNTEEKRMIESYSLRDFYINPKFIVFMADNDKLNNLHQKKPIIKDLMPGTRFTKLSVACGMYGTVRHDILGPPEQHLAKIRGEQK